MKFVIAHPKEEKEEIVEVSLQQLSPDVIALCLTAPDGTSVTPLHFCGGSIRRIPLTPFHDGKSLEKVGLAGVNAQWDKTGMGRLIPLL